MIAVKAAFALLAVALLAGCSTEPPPLVTVSEAQVIALPTSAAAYFTLANSGGHDRLLAVDASSVGHASLHETRMDGDMMRMREIESGIEIPERGRVRLAASGRHVMIQNLVRPLVPGSSLALILHFERQGDVTVHARVDGPR